MGTAHALSPAFAGAAGRIRHLESSRSLHPHDQPGAETGTCMDLLTGPVLRHSTVTEFQEQASQEKESQGKRHYLFRPRVRRSQEVSLLWQPQSPRGGRDPRCHLGRGVVRFLEDHVGLELSAWPALAT